MTLFKKCEIILFVKLRIHEYVFMAFYSHSEPTSSTCKSKSLFMTGTSEAVRGRGLPRQAIGRGRGRQVFNFHGTPEDEDVQDREGDEDVQD